MQDIQPEAVTPDRLVEILLCGQCQSNRTINDLGQSHEDDLQHSSRIEKDSGTSTQEVVILDCQNPAEFAECHIRNSINVFFPSIMVRRIQAGRNMPGAFLKLKELMTKVPSDRMTFVVYDSYSPPTDNETGPEMSDLVSLVAKKLAQNGCRVAVLHGGLLEFKELFPEWIEWVEAKKGHSSISSEDSCAGSPSPQVPLSEVPLLGLGSLAALRIKDDTDSTCDSTDDAFPVEIIPNLFLGNAATSSDEAALARHNIKHILNVTANLPNLFEKSIRYMQLPVSDHWSQSMFPYFPSALQFIDEGRGKEEGVLVHCLAGISRSVTITMAYLMFKRNMSLNEAYDVVRAKKSNISPNFHFMGQLLDFERQLNSSFLSPPALGCSPDSGIEFDRFDRLN